MLDSPRPTSRWLPAGFLPLTVVFETRRAGCAAPGPLNPCNDRPASDPRARRSAGATRNLKLRPVWGVGGTGSRVPAGIARDWVQWTGPERRAVGFERAVRCTSGNRSTGHHPRLSPRGRVGSADDSCARGLAPRSMGAAGDSGCRRIRAHLPPAADRTRLPAGSGVHLDHSKSGRYRQAASRPGVAGRWRPNPHGRETKKREPVAQLVEQRTFNP